MAARELVVMAMWENTQDQPQKGLRLAKEALGLYRKIKCDKGQEAVALLLLVEALVLKSQNKHALKEAKNGVTRFKDDGDKRGIAFGLQILLQVQNMADESEEALQLADEAMEVIQDLGNKRME